MIDTIKKQKIVRVEQTCYLCNKWVVVENDGFYKQILCDNCKII